MKNLMIALLIVDTPIVLLALLLGDENIIFSSQMAFISSTLVIFSSFESYKKMVERRLSLMERDSDLSMNMQDSIDKIEDPHSLYDDVKDVREKELERVLKEEKKRLKNRKKSGLKLKNIKESKSFFNPLKILSYLLLAVGFLYLNSIHKLNMLVYLSTLAIPIITVIWVLIKYPINKDKSVSYPNGT